MLSMHKSFFKTYDDNQKCKKLPAALTPKTSELKNYLEEKFFEEVCCKANSVKEDGGKKDSEEGAEKSSTQSYIDDHSCHFLNGLLSYLVLLDKILRQLFFT